MATMDPGFDPSPRVALVTGPDAARAGALARGLVEERLAACVNVLPGLRSIYRWEGAVEEATEALLVIKTTADRLPGLKSYLAREHPYDVPECIAFEPADVEGRYLAWWLDGCRDPEGPR